ncbi:MAG: GntR family transcriptional regulator, partial [Rhodobacter sp.]|nr:GntR family transcriptional regulator [Rhodobacter sp.]
MPIQTRLPDSKLAEHDRLYRSLRVQVMHGELPPGQALTLRGLARSF